MPQGNNVRQDMTNETLTLVPLRAADDTIYEFDHGRIPTKLFDIVADASGTTVGGITLRYSDNQYLNLYRGHSGFTIDEAHRRHGYATAALIQVMRIAREIGLARIVVTCREDNTASEKTICRAGLFYEATVDVPAETYLWKHGIKRVKRFCKRLEEDPAQSGPRD